jgi:hypothetical protein
MKWILTSSFAKIILLTSSDAAYAAHPHALHNMYYASIHHPPLPLDLHWQPFPQYERTEEDSPLAPLILNKSFASFLYSECVKAAKPLLVLSMYTREGPQNAGDANVMVRHLWSYLKKSAVIEDEGDEWAMPMSWASLFIESVDVAPEILFC